MKKMILIAAVAALGILICSGPALAHFFPSYPYTSWPWPTQPVPEPDPTPEYPELTVEYIRTATGAEASVSTAPGYTQVSHTTDYWQRLGNQWLVNDGVDWSVDGGASWGHDVMHWGHSVIFRFDFQRTDDGLHEYDQLKSWIDWNGDKDWDDAGEQLIAEKWYQWDPSEEKPFYFDNYRLDNGLPVNLIQQYFFAEVVVPDYAVLGETWLRARVHCTETPFEDFSWDNNVTQGEVEDYAVIIASPEPSTFLLLGAGLLALLWAGARRNREAKVRA
ncbi:PEP-CTERM sorting domain-containing protein [Pseudodesulfovibrio cashew]|uniref:PEP-CTERM sorting domain-containing protein n=1 Tax=Pseudodesulfovibrio cashew TaxID=2678688 RepID=A0A6I6JHU5_9BACT|nr:GEVED domain-containing protein [Pseudodesulfovibrio cashew]QGY39677.1 PEP-CTERM sorting domain-containing protein [Pseudodesulfovibrio cashew]